MRMAIFLLPGNGAVRVAIYQKMSYHLPTPAGVQKNPSLDQSLAFLPILVDRLVANPVSYQSNVLIPVSYFVMPVLVLPARTWAPFNYAFAVRDRRPEDALIRVMTMAGAVARFAVT